jgi:hypothetical protein
LLTHFETIYSVTFKTFVDVHYKSWSAIAVWYAKRR